MQRSHVRSLLLADRRQLLQGCRHLEIVLFDRTPSALPLVVQRSHVRSPARRTAGTHNRRYLAS
eukprot:3900386-Prymnesium_polylepis.2